MAKGIEISDDLVAGLVPVLKDPDALEALHRCARDNDTLLHLTHTALISGLRAFTGYGDNVVRAADIGAKAYETLGANVGEPIPTDFALQILASREIDPNFGLHLGEQMDDQRTILINRYPFLAQGLYDLCLAQLKDPSLAAVYGLGSAAVMRAAHEEVYEMWQFEKQFN